MVRAVKLGIEIRGVFAANFATELFNGMFSPSSAERRNVEHRSAGNFANASRPRIPLPLHAEVGYTNRRLLRSRLHQALQDAKPLLGSGNHIGRKSAVTQDLAEDSVLVAHV